MQYAHLAQERKFLISKLFQAGCSYCEIGGQFGCRHSTISQKIKRNAGKRGYRDKQADEFTKYHRREDFSVSRKMTKELKAGVILGRGGNISQCPREIEEKIRIGDWGTDTINCP